MIGILLTALSRLAGELGATVGKWEARRGKETAYMMGFLDSLWATVFLIALALYVPTDFFAPGFPGGFVFSIASLPTFLPRLVLEIFQAYATVHAVMLADRSTFGFLRITTIPLLLGADVFLGYAVGFGQIAGMALIIASLILLFINHGIQRTGAWLVLFTALNAVLTISLYKYDITYFNSPAAEQAIVSIVLLLFFLGMAIYRGHENPLRLLLKPVFFMQSALLGVAGVTASFAYLFSAASVITAAERAFTVLFSVLAGRMYFHEKKLWLKVAAFFLIAVGLALLAR